MNPYIKLPTVPIIQGRQEIIIARCQNKRVLHLGCVDAGLLEERFARQELMHQRLGAVCKELWGVDVDREGIAFLQNKGIGKLIAGDICNVATFTALQHQQFDIILMSEVIEHLENPGLCLDAVSTLMLPTTELIITVPNAFRIDTVLCLFRGIEYIHPDHNYWFSYHTITTLVQKKGYQINEFYVYSLQPMNLSPVRFKTIPASFADSSKITSLPIELWRRIYKYILSLPKRILVSFLYHLTPFWGDGFIIVARRDEK